MTRTRRPNVLAILVAVVVAGLAVFAFAFVAVVGLVMVAGLFIAGSVASLLSRGHRSSYGVAGDSSTRPAQVTIIEGEVVEEHSASRAELTAGHDD